MKSDSKAACEPRNVATTAVFVGEGDKGVRSPESEVGSIYGVFCYCRLQKHLIINGFLNGECFNGNSFGIKFTAGFSLYLITGGRFRFTAGAGGFFRQGRCLAA